MIVDGGEKWAVVAPIVVAPHPDDEILGVGGMLAMLPVALDEASHAALMKRSLADPTAEITIDLESRTVTLPDGATASFPIDAFSRACLLAGVDQLGYLLKQQDHIADFEAART